MTFTSRVVKIGEGWDEPPLIQEEFSPYHIPRKDILEVGAEGSFDDFKQHFPDTYVDMVRDAEIAANAPTLPQSKTDQKSVFSSPRHKKTFYN